MGLLRLRLRAESRAARRWIGAILLLALAGGAALTAAQAARRTDTAFSRDLADAGAADAIVNANAYGSTQRETEELRASALRMLDTVDRSPVVGAHARVGGANLFRVHDGKIDQTLNSGTALGKVAYDRRAGYTVSTPQISAGRLADPDRADEITVNPQMADVTGWRVGSVATDLREYESKDLDPETGAPRPDRGTPLKLRVVGVVEPPEELLQPRSERIPRVYLTQAFGRRYPETVYYLNEWVRLRRGAADLPALRAEVAKANRADLNVGMTVSPTIEQLSRVNRANDPLVNGLWLLALLFALVGVLLGAQSLGRILAARADDHAQLRALGATRPQRGVAELATLAIGALTAAGLAAVLGYLFSPLTPIGAARDAEPHAGFSLNLALSAAAIGAIFAGTTIAALPALRRLVRARALPGADAGPAEPRPRRSRVADLVARAGFGPPAVVGTRLALQPGRGPTATPVRSVLTSLTLVVATVTATFAFGVNLQRWTSTPRLYGWNWDAAAGQTFGPIPREFEQAIEHFPNVREASALTLGHLTIAGHAITGIGIDRVRGNLVPRVDAGRLPTNPSEIVLGEKTMRAIHRHIGDTVDATVGATRAKLLIVGRATFPAFGDERGAESGLGNGALGTAARFPVHDPGIPDGRYNYMLVRFAPGTAAKAEQELRTFLGKNGCSDPTCVITDSRPAEIDGYRSARRLPLTIGIVLLLLLVATLTHVLVSTMRRRSGDLAILRALGCRPRNLVAVMGWQSLTLTSVAIVIGVPCGLIANRVAWSAFSHQLGITPGTVSPFAALALGALGVLVVATALATAVGLRAPGVTRRHRFAS